ncbi:SDR family NAD(P)-dependent oxidoreductase [Maricaulis parjimensis]|uniref:SDR family NAD(P)-dependent oxidoreductase n=1 Tax=Maricaulis parjimensis TaxID=144023 RepID=UPI0019398D1E|nr:SDR family oxidoreductase [Maricaulis parjimensis]
MSAWSLAGERALITGAASGIGAALAEGLAQRGCHLILTDINEAGLEPVAEKARALGVEVDTYKLDVADPQAIQDLFGAVSLKYASVSLLFNNAGVALGGTFEEVSPENFDWLMSINFFGVVRMARAFMPLLKAAKKAQIINVSSIFGIVAPPGQTAYSSAKFGVRGFSNALRHELRGSSIGVTTIHPGGIATSIATSARMPDNADESEVAAGRERANKALVMPPSKAAEIILRGVERRIGRVLVGNDAHVLAWLERLFPVSYWGMVERLLSSRVK